MRLPAAFAIYRRRLDPYLVTAGGALVLIGLLAVYSATEFPDSARAGFFARHLVALPLAFGVMALAMAVPLRVLEDLGILLYVVTTILLVAVLLFGTEVYGARRWLGAGPFRMQPSELAKLATTIALAQFLATKKRDPARWSTLLPAVGMVLLPLALVLKEPDLGTSGAFAVMGIAVVLWSGLPWLHTLLMMSPLASLILCRHYVFWAAYLVVSVLALWRVRLSWLVLALFVVIQTAVMFGAPVLWNHLEPYQRMRLTVFEHPERDPSGGGYQIMQSKIAIGSGGIWGKGYLKGSQKALAFLPQQHTDFIYSVVGEEAGFLGCLVTIILFLLVILRGYYLALHCRSPFAGLLAVGIATLLLYHAGVNMAMTVGLLPVTGLPLPFVSYGGSFQLSVFAMLGLLLNISAHRFDY